MPTLQSVLAELQALSTVTEDQFETALAAVVTDLESVISATADPVVTVTTTTLSGVAVVFVPKA